MRPQGRCAEALRYASGAKVASQTALSQWGFVASLPRGCELRYFFFNVTFIKPVPLVRLPSLRMV